jgi:outer membrane protein OmpA-like peptidoglycan-associated protein
MFIAATLASSALAATPSASAQVRFGVRGEFTAGTMLSDWQRATLQLDSVALGGAGRLYVAPIDWLSIQASASYWAFLSNTTNAGVGGVLGVTGGLRFEPMLGRVGRLFVDGNAGVGFTGSNPAPLTRFHFDAGLGFEFQLHQWFSLGPVARFGYVLQPDDDPAPADAMWIAGGLSLSFGSPRAETTAPPSDSDRDGVIDDEDQCVNEPQGEHPDPSRRGCPDGDADNDGVRNSLDQCRDVPAGPRPDPNRAGCPIADRDGDSVPDDVDRCPDQPGAPSTDPNRNGCPGQVRVNQGMIEINTPVFFAHNRDTILPRSFPILQAVGDALRASPHIRRVSIEGHTDDVGGDQENMDLSNRRAQSVLRWLSEHGVEASRLEAHGFGESRPLEPVQPSMNRRARRAAQARNRRVEFRIVDPAPDSASSTSAPPAD